MPAKSTTSDRRKSPRERTTNPEMASFEKTTSSTEFWNIASSLLAIRLAVFYFGLTFLTGCILGYIRLEILIPALQLSQPRAELFEMPLMLVAIVFWARFLIAQCKIPSFALLRLVIGLLALVFMLSAEFLGGLILYEEGLRERIWTGDKTSGTAFAASLLLFGLMPWILSLTEKEVVKPDQILHRN